MSTLVNELMAFTKAGMQPRDVALTAVDLEPLARDVLAREGADERVAVAIAPGLSAQADADLLGRALGNLVRNALRYAGDAGPVSVSAIREGNRVVLAVEDQGPGVPPADLDRLGEPFFRPELARTREGGGVGLGLAIVRSSIAACQGEVRFARTGYPTASAPSCDWRRLDAPHRGAGRLAGGLRGCRGIGQDVVENTDALHPQPPARVHSVLLHELINFARRRNKRLTRGHPNVGV